MSDTIKQWMQALPISWLVGNEVGHDDAAAQGTAYDEQVDLLRLAIKARMPSVAPVDALAHIGGDRNLIQGPAETDDNFRIRLETAWDDWARAGQPVELLTQLYWAGYTDAIIVQQNGSGFYLSGAPTPGEDPTSLMVQFDLSELTAALHSDVDTSRSIPAGTPWWTFDSDTDFCSRFALIFPTPPAVWSTTAVAVFDGTTDTVTATWSDGFSSTTYNYSMGVVVTDSLGPVVVTVSTKDTVSITVIASEAFTGEVHFIGWVGSVNPFLDYSDDQVAILRSIVRTWRRGTSTPVTAVGISSGYLFGYPLRTFGDMVGDFGDYSGEIAAVDMTGA